MSSRPRRPSLPPLRTPTPARGTAVGGIQRAGRWLEPSRRPRADRYSALMSLLRNLRCIGSRLTIPPSSLEPPHTLILRQAPLASPLQAHPRAPPPKAVLTSASPRDGTPDHRPQGDCRHSQLACWRGGRGGGVRPRVNLIIREVGPEASKHRLSRYHCAIAL